MAERPVGRPAEFAEPMVPISTRLPASVAAATDRLSMQSGVSVHAIVRQAIAEYVSRNSHGGTRRAQ